MSSPTTGRLHTLRRSLGGTLVDGFFRGVSRAGALHPKADPRAHGVERIRDVAYLDEAGRVLRVQTVQANRVSLPCWSARMAVEAEAGQMAHWGVRPGDTLEIK